MTKWQGQLQILIHTMVYKLQLYWHMLSFIRIRQNPNQVNKKNFVKYQHKNKKIKSNQNIWKKKRDFYGYLKLKFVHI